MVSRGLKILFVFSVLSAVGITLVGGYWTAEQAPPYPSEVRGPGGERLFTSEDIHAGQVVWQRHGLMDNGSVWGHGTYRGNDYTATTLHLVGQHMRDFHARGRYGAASYAALPADQAAAVDATVIAELKENRLEPGSLALQLTAAQVYAWGKARDHWDATFGAGDLRNAVWVGTVPDAADRAQLARFFLWTAWAAGTLRPGKDLTYTNNWPPDRSVGNEIAGSAVVWTLVSLVALMLALGGALAWFFRGKFDKDLDGVPLDSSVGQKLVQLPISASQRKTAKFFLVVALMFFLQLCVGGLMAHYTVHPGEFYGIDAIAENVPYAWPKSWHLQLAIFWIATAWVGAALYLAPIAGGREPRKQGVLVDVLFGALVAVVGGSLAGSALGVKMGGGEHWFWLGHQGWEFLELGRLWQILLFVGLVVWLVIVARAVRPHFRPGADRWGTVPFYTYSAIAIVSFFAFGLFYDSGTHIVVADFWRWWVVHTWVEGIFEFFAAAAIAFLVITLGLAPKRKAMRAAYLTASLALFSGIIGVGHHYYWFGDPDLWIALGGVVSTMEPVPIVLLLLKVVLDARKNPQALSNANPYKWPLLFVGASSAWAFLGAGVFGFMITTPAMNYFEHSTYLTMNHGHTALFGTYGMLAIGLLLFALRGLVRPERWSDRLLKVAFWGLNGGLFAMAIFTLLPVGFLQVWDVFEHGLWHARSAEFYEQPLVQFIGEWRLLPDLVILAGALALVVFVVRAFFQLKPVGIPDDVPVELPSAEPVPALAPAAATGGLVGAPAGVRPAAEPVPARDA